MLGSSYIAGPAASSLVPGRGSKPSSGAHMRPASQAEHTRGSVLPCRNPCAFILREKDTCVGFLLWDLAFAEHLDSMPGFLHMWLH